MKTLAIIFVLLALFALPLCAQTFVQSASGYTANSGTVTVSSTPHAGDTLIMTVGMYSTGIFWNLLQQQLLPFTDFVTDSQDNRWYFVGMSPAQFYTSCYCMASEATWVATNVAGAPTTITAQTVAQYVFGAVDEYSGVASVRAIDGINFNSTVAGSGSTSIASGNITINGTETAYSVGFADTAGETLTASAGYTQRQTSTNVGGTITTFDKSYTGGTASNTISANSAPGTLHAILLALAPSPVPSLILQQNYMVNTGTITTSVTSPFRYPNGSGNLLIVTAKVYERNGYQVTDTQNNSWHVVTCSTPPNLVMAYTLSSKPGANTVTLTGTTGGDDVTLSMVETEYNIQGAVFNTSSCSSPTTGSTTVNTGSISVAANSLLVSAMEAASNGATWVALAKIGSSPNTWRIQPSDGNNLQSGPYAQAQADEIVGSSGSYSNTFTVSSSSDQLVAGILGFTLPSTSGGNRPHPFAMTDLLYPMMWR